MESLRPKLAGIPGMRVFLSNPPVINLGARWAAANFQYTLQGLDLKELYSGAQTLFARLRDLPEVMDLSSDLRLGSPELNFVVDGARAGALGLSRQKVEDALYSAYSGRQISTILTPNNQYTVHLELLPEFQRDRKALDLLYLRSRDGALVPLSTLVRFETGVGPTMVNHSGQLPAR